MTKKHHEPDLTPEQQKLADEMAHDFEKLAQAEKLADPKVEAQGYEDEPARFRTGGATASEIAAWREVHGTPAGVVPEGVVPLGMAEAHDSEGGTTD